MDKRTKYTNEEINNLVEAAKKTSELPNINNYLDSLYYISVNGTLDRYREALISQISDDSFFDAMRIIENIQFDLTENDIPAFNKLDITKKAEFFRLANLANSEPQKIYDNESILKSIGSIQSNFFKEANRLETEDKALKEYALLTSKVRDRFKSKYSKELTEVSKIVNKSRVKPTPEQPSNKAEVKNRNKIKL